MHKIYKNILDILAMAAECKAIGQFRQSATHLEYVRDLLIQTGRDGAGEDYYNGWGIYYQECFELHKLFALTGPPALSIEAASACGWLGYFRHFSTLCACPEHQILVDLSIELIDEFMIDDKDRLYADSYRQLRLALHAAYTFLALDRLNSGHGLQARKLIDQCFKLESVADEHLDSIVGGYDAQALIYRTATRVHYQ